MQTDQSACHSPIGSFQRTCYVVIAPAANGQMLRSTANPPWRHDSDATGRDLSSHTGPGDAACPW
jgi:hypothetical protein